MTAGPGRRFVATLLDRVDQLLGSSEAERPEHDFPTVRGGELFVDEWQALGQDPRIADSLAIIAAPHLDPSIRDRIAQSWGQPPRRHVDGALLLRLLCTSREDMLELAELYVEDGPLHRAGLIESVPANLSHQASPLEQELVPTPRLLHVIS